MTDCYACYTDEQVRLVLGGNGARVLRISGTPRDNSRMANLTLPYYEGWRVMHSESALRENQ
jgi:hypothetical protein